MMELQAIFSAPGPVESAVLAELAGTFEPKRRLLPPVTLRLLEGGQGEPVLLLHGRLHAATMWQPILTELAPTRRVIAPDLPGFGHSSSPAFRGADREAAVRFFVDPIAALVRALGLEEAPIVGHSLGGLVALELVLRGHARPKKLALIAPLGLGGAIGTAARAFYRIGPECIVRALGPALFSRVLASSRGRMPARLAALEAELVSVLGGKAPPTRAFNALVSSFGPAYERSSDLKRIDVETLLLWGGRDPVLPAPIAIAAAASMPRAKLVMLPELGHAPHLEDAARVGPMLASFLS